MRKKLLVVGQVFIAISIFLTAGGCGSGDTKSVLGEVKEGMTLAEVEEILGEGVEQSEVVAPPGGGDGAAKDASAAPVTMTWINGTKIVTIKFVDGKATKISEVQP